MTKRAATAEAILISQTAAQRAPRKIVNRTGDGPNYAPNIPQDIVKEGQAIHRSAHRTARVFFTFFSTYSPQHIWNKVPENLFEWNDPVKRWDPVFPLNVKIAHAYELRKATDNLGLEWIKRETPAYKQEVRSLAVHPTSGANPFFCSLNHLLLTHGPRQSSVLETMVLTYSVTSRMRSTLLLLLSERLVARLSRTRGRSKTQ